MWARRRLSEQQLADTGLNVIRTPLVTVPGAAIPFPYGGKTRQILIDLNSEAMQARGLSGQEVANALANQNLITPVGSQKIGAFEYTVQLNNAPSVISELGDLPIKAMNGAMIYIRDTDLAFGEHLRRAQHRTEARPYLRSALHEFEQLGGEPFVARAANELRASGETARKRDPSTALALTPMELQTARLAARNMSNKDIATQLWISPRTVAFHLRNVFTKTGISSRGELGRLGLG